MLFVASPKYSHFVLMAAAVGVVGVVFISFEAYRMDRIKIWLNPEAYEKGYQTLQGLYAIGSGGLFGKGLGESMQKLGFIPEAQNDMIFSVICEELGLFGAVCVILLFLLMIWRFMIFHCRLSVMEVLRFYSCLQRWGLRFPWQRELNLRLIKYDKRREKKKKAQKDRIVHPVDIDSAYRSGRFHCHECFYRGKRCRGGK